jgi:uncharacterized protein DUF5320
MPGLDRTGPQSQGSMTGGARGNCNTSSLRNVRSKTSNPGYGRGMARGRNFSGGYGRGMTRKYARNIGTPDEELNNLKAEVDLLNRRIAELEKTL